MKNKNKLIWATFLFILSIPMGGSGDLFFMLGNFVGCYIMIHILSWLINKIKPNKDTKTHVGVE